MNRSPSAPGGPAPQKPPLFLLDYDGTLTDFKKNPEQSRISPSTRALLVRLRRKHPVILVSGRHVRGLEKVSGLRGFPIVGTHGFESRRLPGGLRMASAAQERLFAREAGKLWKGLRALLREYPAVHLERKPFSSTLHYRGVRLSPSQGRDLHRKFRKIFAQTVTRASWSLMEGKKMIEAMPKGFSKGKSVRRILASFPGHFPIFAGDDLTDISVLKILSKKGLRIVVGSRIPKRYSDLRFPAPRHFLSWLGRFV